mgnify:CR=1 FL=1
MRSASLSYLNAFLCEVVNSFLISLLKMWLLLSGLYSR